MSQNRTLSLEHGRTTKAVYVMGTQLTIPLYRTAPPSAAWFIYDYTAHVHCQIVQSRCSRRQPLSKDTKMIVTMDEASLKEGDGQVLISYYNDVGKEVGSKELLLTAVEISLDVDADRDGVVEKNNPHKGSWKWGPEGYGAILLVNCNSESGKKPDCEKRYIASEKELQDMSLMMLRVKGPEKLPDGYRLLLHTSAPDAEGIRVFGEKQETGDEMYPVVLESGKISRQVDYRPTKETTFYVEGAKFTDKDFSGQVYIHVSLVEQGALETQIFTDTVLFKVAPWIMIPNVQKPLEVFVCSETDNKAFLKAMEDLVKKIGCKLNTVPKTINLGDRWMQDEIEFGYIEAPLRSFPVVLDSPRDLGLDNFAYNQLLGPDFGFVTREPPRAQVCGMDSFGNLEVSPPVTVNGKNYPLGRIYYGGAYPFQPTGRNRSGMVQDFLHAQAVQKPIVIFSDWLLVGHVDEFTSFVPAKDRKGFRLLLASTDATYKLFKDLQDAGHGQAKLFEDCPDPTVKWVTVDEILADDKLRADNEYYQRCLNWNRDCLKTELGLDEADIVDVPSLFIYSVDGERKGALAYMPGMVNMIVLGENLGIAKPYGPKVDGKCTIEQEMTKLMGNLGLKCNFIDDFVPYHNNQGEVHCASNVRRQPFDIKWWELEM